MVGRVQGGSSSCCRVPTDDKGGVIRAYLGEGELTADPLETFGGFVVRVPDFQGSLRHSCASGYGHQFAVNRAQVAEALNEASTRYMDWDIYHCRA